MSVWNYQTTAGTRWRFKIEVRRRRITRKGFITKAEATHAERIARQEALRENWQAIDSTRQRDPSPFTPLEKITATYKTAPRSPARAERNVQALENICRQTGRDITTMTAADINPDFIRAWFDHRATLCKTLNQTDTLSSQTTANSLIVAALSIFNETARDHYQQQNLHLPDYTETFRTAKAQRFRLARREYHPPDQTTIDNTLAAWLKITDDPNLFHVIGLALCTGLRKEEITQARWDHFTTRDHYAVYHARHDVKNQTGEILVKCLAPYHQQYLTIAKTRGWHRPQGGPILAGQKTEREDYVFRRLSKFLTAQGWRMRKKAHALRDYAISCVAVKHSIYDACKFARHADVSTTQEHYGNFVDMWSFRDKDTLPWDWSKADPQTPTLSVISA